MEAPISYTHVVSFFLLAVLLGIIIGACALVLIQRCHRRRMINGRNTFIHRV